MLKADAARATLRCLSPKLRVPDPKPYDTNLGIRITSALDKEGAIPLRNAEQLSHMTVLITTALEHGAAATGTGYFLRLNNNEDKSSIPVIITNKHVIAGAKSGSFKFTLSTQPPLSPRFGQAIDFVHQEFQKGWVHHPDPNVDLVAMPLAWIIQEFQNRNQLPFVITIPMEWIAYEEDLSLLDVCEDVVMVGYPNGLWDTANNLPVVRRGIIASPPSLNHNGKSDFLIDCACYPGSSGSPILLFNPYGFIDNRTGNYEMGQTRIKLLGTLYAGPTITNEGQIVVTPIPTNSNVRVLSKSMMNLGYCVKALNLKFFETYFSNLGKMATGK